MNDYTPQTSASDRYAAARTWLDDFDKKDQRAEICWHDMPEDFEDFLASVRALITPPGVHESEEQIAERVYEEQFGAFGLGALGRDVAHLALLAAVRAGIQNAHERWEPSDRPTQEQMLRWLGVTARPARIKGDVRIFIPAQYIEREED